MYTLSALFSNVCLISVGIAWLLAQILKIFTGYFSDNRFSITKLFCGTGGMPSSHSATVVALLVSSAIRYGFASFNVAVSFLLAIIVMSDAAGVRYAASQQARLLNQITEELFTKHTFNVPRLKEMLGHTRKEVLAGMVTGIIVAVIVIKLWAHFLR
jgi:acid phosphatase family membrane protein YuiD